MPCSVTKIKLFLTKLINIFVYCGFYGLVGVVIFYDKKANGIIQKIVLSYSVLKKGGYVV